MDDEPTSPKRPPVAWLDGQALAMQDELPMGTQYRHPVRSRHDDPLVMSPTKGRYHEPVIVVAWPDGPVPPPPVPTADTLAQAMVGVGILLADQTEPPPGGWPAELGPLLTTLRSAGLSILGSALPANSITLAQVRLDARGGDRG